MREHEQIVERIREIDGSGMDLFGVKVGHLLTQLEFEDAKEFLLPTATPEEWKESMATLEDSRVAAAGYMSFAVSKADGHRGLSASRSVEHYDSWVWLHGTDEQYAAFQSAGYRNYGAPKLKVAAEVFKLDWAEVSTPAFRRMADGLPCTDDCNEGCGQ